MNAQKIAVGPRGEAAEATCTDPHSVVASSQALSRVRRLLVFAGSSKATTLPTSRIFNPSV